MTRSPRRDIDHVPESRPVREPIRATEGLRRETRSRGSTGAGTPVGELDLQRRSAQHLVVEDLLEPAKRLIAAGVLGHSRRTRVRRSHFGNASRRVAGAARPCRFRSAER